MYTLARNACLAGTVLGLSLIAAGTAEAASITREFIVEIGSGDLAGESFLGGVTYDDSILTGESVTLFPGEFSLTFDFLGTAFTEADDFLSSATAQIGQSGRIRGLGYTVDSLDSPNAFFGFAPSSDSIGDEFFYEQFDATGAVVDAGEGTLVSVSVPEPATAVALGVLGLSALVSRKSRQAA
ncbi:MAG: PEP-CTERM sorting domain-containing protein [Cyanobacteria bacterium P01_F01_bin.86]